jgi:hypothetical protein
VVHIRLLMRSIRPTRAGTIWSDGGIPAGFGPEGAGPRGGRGPRTPSAQSARQPDIQRVDFTLLKPDRFPKEIFNGDKFVETARKDGAVMEVDQ